MYFPKALRCSHSTIQAGMPLGKLSFIGVSGNINGKIAFNIIREIAADPMEGDRFDLTGERSDFDVQDVDGDKVPEIKIGLWNGGLCESCRYDRWYSLSQDSVSEIHVSVIRVLGPDFDLI